MLSWEFIHNSQQSPSCTAATNRTQIRRLISISMYCREFPINKINFTLIWSKTKPIPTSPSLKDSVRPKYASLSLMFKWTKLKVWKLEMNGSIKIAFSVKIKTLTYKISRLTSFCHHSSVDLLAALEWNTNINLSLLCRREPLLTKKQLQVLLNQLKKAKSSYSE